MPEPTTVESSSRIPVAATPFIGREGVLTELRSVVAGPRRVVTILGPPGVGKTRTSQELARAWLEDLSDVPEARAWFVDLSGASSSSDLALETAQTLGVDRAIAAEVPELLTDLGAIIDSAGSALVILDNAEQVLPPVVRALETWLAAAPEARFVVTSRERARELSSDASIEVRIAGFGMARAEKAFMPYAPVPAAQRALDDAGVSLDKIDAVKTHNPFAVNDIVFSRETGRDVMAMNNYGCSLVWGHPHAATGLRSVIELIEELAQRGGGTGLFTGCAAGDSAMAVVVEVGAA